MPEKINNYVTTNLEKKIIMSNYAKRTILYCALTLMLGLALGLLSDLLRHPYREPDVVVRTDTITKTVPLEVEKVLIREVPVKLPVVRTQVREVYVPLDPEMVEHHADSAVVAVPITQKEYADSDYTAWVSGYEPRLDSIRIYRRTYLPKGDRRPKLQLSVGVGATYNGRLSPGIFIGVSYPIKEIRL